MTRREEWDAVSNRLITSSLARDTPLNSFQTHKERHMQRPPSATSISLRLFLILWMSLTALATTWNWMTETRFWSFLEVTAIAALVTTMLHVVISMAFRLTRQ